MYETTDVSSEQPASRGGHFPGDVVNGHVLGDDLEWRLVEKPSVGKKIEGWFYVALALGIFVVLPIALIIWIGSAIFGGDDSSDTPVDVHQAALYLAWNNMDSSQQRDICLGYNLDSDWAVSEVRQSWGSTAPSATVVDAFFAGKC